MVAERSAKKGGVVMNPREIFGLLVRVSGLLTAVSGIVSAHRWLGSMRVLDALVFIILYVMITAYLLRGAPRLVRFSYPDECSHEREQD